VDIVEDSCTAGLAPGPGLGRSASEVAELLRSQIQEGVWQPGQWLREARLCTEFGVGRSVVRRALRTLADDGLLVIEANRGASVKLTTLQEVFDLFELRAGLYGVAARFACIRASADLLADIIANADQLMAASESGASAEDLIGHSERIFSLMADTASADTQAAIALVRRKTRWHYSYAGLAEGPGPFDHWRFMRAALAKRDAGEAAEGARNILYYMQSEVTRVMLGRGLGGPESIETLASRSLAGSGKRRT
jgi:DNA-binding GntR family transcriptional regulator